MTARFEDAIAAIDQVNAGDPHVIDAGGGADGPKELVHSRRMTSWVLRLDPAASDEQLLAARAHHLRRWSVPRQTYPEGRAGYLRWRAALRKQHAEEVVVILQDAGYDPEAIDRVQRLIRKEGLGSEAPVQVHEDALCLVFLELQLAELVERLGADRVVEVLRKTIAKMSEGAKQLALGLDLGTDGHALLERALAE